MESFKTTTETKEAPQAPRLIERLRARTPESIETFDINNEGLAIHGTKLERLESVLRGGLGSFHSDSLCGQVWFNVVGTPAILRKEETKMDTRIGFGGDKTMFGGEVVLVSDVFKEMWPNMINGIVKLGHAGNGVGGEIRIEFGLYDHGSINIDFTGNEWGEADWNNTEELPGPEELLIPEFKKEEIWRSSRDGKKHVEVGSVVNNSQKTVWYGNERFEQISLPPYQQLLGRAAFNAIVITNRRDNISAERTIESIVEEIIEIQNRIKIPKEEQLPIFDESGKCLYNPLTQ